MKQLRRYLLLYAIIFISISSNSQVIYVEGEDIENRRLSQPSIDISNPWQHGLGVDVYAQLEGSVLVLSGFGIIYLLKKKENRCEL